MGKRPSKKAKRQSTQEHAARGEGGRWLPGASANPAGRPAIADEIANLAKADSPEAYAKVVQIMRHDGARQQLAAALAILKVAGVFRGTDAPTDKPPMHAPQIPDSALDAIGVH